MVLLGLAARALKRNMEDKKPAVVPMAQQYSKGGKAKESPAMMKKEIAFMKKKGAPKSMIAHEKAEAKGMRKGGMACGGVKKYAAGGELPAISKKRIAELPPGGTPAQRNDRLAAMQERDLRNSPPRPSRARGNYAKGGGIESKGKTKGRMC